MCLSGANSGSGIVLFANAKPMWFVSTGGNRWGNQPVLEGGRVWRGLQRCENEALDEAAEVYAEMNDHKAECEDGRVKGQLPGLPNVPMCITVVGGDEMQARYDDSLRKAFECGSNKIDLNFRHTNWSSNYGEQFEQMRPLLDRSDAVIVMRRIRTTLGRNLRRYCPTWIGCAGDGKLSIERAIRAAVSLVRARQASRR